MNEKNSTEHHFRDAGNMVAGDCLSGPPFFALVNGKVTHMPGDTRDEAEDLMRLSFWMCGKKAPRIQWSDNDKIHR